ncbi:F-box/FBD/LRR-repeat protein At1g51370-like isoform X2 [Dioscorea cayenensis subsp. rotundata]|uniref:F-box/FBD/LRR-repeat protein At1g51370-like isoform X2 n=1 Tax=Dioscorea cayennensis subsp. rotundata TaxID=55577 RepID=A0AB40BSI1_DIOCR|nr:F-box/FBD/LRR-repeat protein At1g51370-like isoform X2 [Dioscorea cayenensis subsp. rotundata]
MKRKEQQSALRRRKKAKTDSDEQNDEDRISKLPDELRSYILSKLPTADAMKTSLLSTRWKHTWTSVTNLEFDFGQFPKFKGRNSAFTKFVNQAIITHDGLDIQRFHLQLYAYRSKLPYARFWISFAVRHFVQELELCIPKIALDKLPDLLFTCESLRLLKLDLSGNVLKLPTSVTLINLQTLHLESMSFRDDNVVWELISSCPKLENLTLNNCSMYGMKILNICSSELQNLSLLNCQTFSSCEVNISAPKLKTFRYHCSLVRKLSLEHVCTLTKADIDLHGSLYFVKRDKELSNRAIRILKELDNVRTLTLSARCTEYLSTAIDLLGSFSCNLRTVKHLDVAFWSHKSYIKVLSSLLKCCPTVETLSVGIDMTFTGYSDVPLKNVKTTIPKCLLHKLKTVKLRNLVGVNKLDLVKFLVKNAEVLEKIITVSKEGVVKERTVEWIKSRAQSLVNSNRKTT